MLKNIYPSGVRDCMGVMNSVILQAEQNVSDNEWIP